MENCLVTPAKLKGTIFTDGGDEKLRRVAFRTLLLFFSAAWQDIFVQRGVGGENLRTRKLAVGTGEAASAQQHTRLDTDLNKTASSQAGPGIWQAVLSSR